MRCEFLIVVTFIGNTLFFFRSVCALLYTFLFLEFIVLSYEKDHRFSEWYIKDTRTRTALNNIKRFSKLLSESLDPFGYYYYDYSILYVCQPKILFNLEKCVYARKHNLMKLLKLLILPAHLYIF